MENKKLDWALLVLRIGLAAVFLLFGYQKLSNPLQTAAEIQLVLSLGIGSAAAVNFYLGLLEVIVGLALATGIRTKLFGAVAALLTVSFLASFLVKFGLSINPDLYRDVGLTAIGIALAILGAGRYSWDEKQNPVG